MTQRTRKYKSTARAFPWMPFYVSDYINDHRVMNLTPTGRATYIELLCHSWLLGGSLPYSPAHLWKYTLLQTPEEWNAVADEVLALFEVVEGRLVNTRLTEEYEESQRLADARIRGGKATARKRWGSSVDSSATSPANSSRLARREEKRTKQNKKAFEPASPGSTSGLISSSEDSAKEGQEQGASLKPVPPTEAGARVAQKLAEVLGRSNLKSATMTAWAYQADVLLKTHSETTITAVMLWALADSSDGFWRAKILAMKIFSRCFKTMLAQYAERNNRTQKPATTTDALAERAASLRTGHDFSGLAKGDL